MRMFTNYNGKIAGIKGNREMPVTNYDWDGAGGEVHTTVRYTAGANQLLGRGFVCNRGNV